MEPPQFESSSQIWQLGGDDMLIVTTDIIYIAVFCAIYVIIFSVGTIQCAAMSLHA